MASFEERVKAAAHYNSLSGHGGDARHMETARGALYGADAAEPEIGAVRRWLAGEAVDAAALPRMLSETIRALAEAQQVAERAQGGDAVRQWLDGAGVHEDALPKRLRMTLVELRCARKQRDEYSQRIAARADQPPLGPHERVPELVTAFDTERTERRAVERQRDEARAEVERLKRELDEERAWMWEEKRHNIRMRAALDEIAVCLGRDGDDLKVLVEDVQRCSDGVVAADEKIERLTQERDALAAKVREQTAALTRARAALDEAFPIVHEEDTELGDEMEFASNEITAVLDDAAELDVRDAAAKAAKAAREAGDAAESAQALADAAAKGETPVPWEDVKKRLSIDARCTWPGENHARGCAICDPCGNHEGHVSPTCRTAEDLISWKARALAAEAEVAAEKAAHDGTREALRVCVDGENALTAEVAKLRAALERETAPRMWVGRMAGVEPCTRCGAKWVD